MCLGKSPAIESIYIMYIYQYNVQLPIHLSFTSPFGKNLRVASNILFIKLSHSPFYNSSFPPLTPTSFFVDFVA